VAPRFIPLENTVREPITGPTRLKRDVRVSGEHERDRALRIDELGARPRFFVGEIREA